MTTFQFKQFTFGVKRWSDGSVVFRDIAHLGGPWTDAKKLLANTGYDICFRRSLAKAIKELA